MKYTRKQKSKKEKKKKTKTIEALPLEQFLSIGVCGCGGDFDDKARENIIGVMDMRVPLHDKRVIAHVTDGVQGLPFSHNVYFITRSLTEVVPFYRLTFFFCHGAFPY